MITNIKVDVARALEEDVGSGDVTSALLPEDLIVQAQIISREPMLMCGSAWVDCAFLDLCPDIQLDWLVKDGDYISKPGILCKVQGPARAILTAERTALNFLQTLSGTATNTYNYLQKINGLKTQLLDTRKTIPGLRYAQKYAVKCAGGVNHRLGLFDAYLIKENHIKACGSIAGAVNLARKNNSGILVEVEVESIKELLEALDLQVDRIMLDNFSMEMLRDAIHLRGERKVAFEYSGNVTLANIANIAATGVDYISVGALTKSVKAIDLSLLIIEHE